ncbi:OPT superfamily [Sorochytrium milnesiophthora]
MTNLSSDPEKTHDMKNDHYDEELGIDDKGFVVDEEYEINAKAMLPTTDDVNTPSLTFRVWVLGTFFCIVLGWINQILTFRTNPMGVTSYVAVLLSYPMGRFLATALPTTKFNIPFFGECSLNPGPYSAKETILIYTMASTGSAGVYGTDNIFVQKFYYQMDIGHLACLGFLLATSLSGFGVAGICQRFLVRPAHMLWPTSFPQIALVQSFHAGDNAETDPNVGENGRRHISRLKVFFIACFGIFCYEVIPTWVAPALTYIGVLCLISPNNAVVQMLGSPVSGLGIGSLTFEWSMIGGGSMNLPWWVQVNNFVSSIIFVWILTPLSWRYNWFGSPPLDQTLNSVKIFNKTGDTVSAGDLVDRQTHTLIVDLYETQKPFWISPFFAWGYFSSLALFTCALSHVLAWYGRDIWRRFRSARLDDDKNDIHCQMIDKYPAVPSLWYAAWFVIPAVLGIAVCHFTDIKMPWYLSIFAIVITFLLAVPYSVISATSGYTLATNVISEFLVGMVYPGHPVVMMAFKCLSVTVCGAVITLLQDLKIGHYMKVPPRHMFIAQMYSQIIAVFVCYGTLLQWCTDEHVDWVLNPDSHKSDPVANKWNSQTGYATYFSASLLWGAMGPLRFFFTSYAPLAIAAFVVGTVMPVFLKLAYEYVGGPIPWSLINAPIILTVAGAGGYQSGVIMSILSSLFFQFYMYRRHTKWWQRYNYVLSVALDTGTALMGIVTGYALQSATMPNWALNPADSSDFCPNAVPDKPSASASSF